MITPSQGLIDATSALIDNKKAITEKSTPKNEGRSRKWAEKEEESKEKRPLFSDLLGWLDGVLVQELPTVAPVTPNRSLLYPAAIGEIHGEPGLGKTNVITCCIIAEVKGGGTCLYLDPEDTAKGFVSKLRSLSGDDPEIIAAIRDGRIKYVHNPDPDMIKEAIVWATENKPTMVVLDGLAELMAQEDLNEDLAGDVLKFFRYRVRPFAEKAGSAVLISDHTSKVSTGMYARGSGAKKGRYDGVSYELSSGKPYSPTVAGFVRLKVTKDRKGGVGPMGTHVCDLHFSPTDTEAHTETRWEDAATAATGENGKPQPTTIMARIYEHLSELEKGDSQTRICKSIKGKTETILWALKCLVKDGTIHRNEWDNGSHHYSILPETTPDLPAQPEATPAEPEPAGKKTRSKC